MTPCGNISFCRLACRLDVGESVAYLRKKWCCIGDSEHNALCMLCLVVVW